MRFLTLIFVCIVITLQYPLWFAKGSWGEVWRVKAQIAQQIEDNDKLRIRNESLNAEVVDLKTGYDAIEERARSELGFIKPGEIFYQVLVAQPNVLEEQLAAIAAASAAKAAAEQNAAASTTPATDTGEGDADADVITTDDASSPAASVVDPNVL